MAALISLEADNLVVQITGWDRIWSLKSRLEIPLEHIASVTIDPTEASTMFFALRLPGTHIPGVMAAGTFYHHGTWVFWDVHNPANTIILDLHDERYSRLILEVEDPHNCALAIRKALGPSG